MYPRISIGGSETEQSERTKAGEQRTLSLPSSGTTGVYIKGLDWLSDLGDLSGLQLASRGGSDVISFSVLGKRLRRLKVGDAAGNVAFNATILSVAGKCIEEIDAQNASTISGSLDLKECPRLRTLLLAGTSLANIYPPVGGRLLRVQYPDTLATLFMHSLNLLTEDNIELSDAAKANISTIYINSCDNINAFAFLRSVYNTEGNRLANIGVIWKGVIEDNDATTMVMLGDIAKNAGVDGGYRGVTYNDNGEIISQSVPNISGTIHVNYGVYKEDIDAIEQAHIPLTIKYDADKVYIRFADAAVESICATKWGDGVGLTYPQAAAVKSLGTTFDGNTTITTFDELKEFGVTSLSQYAFRGCKSLKKISLGNIKTLEGFNFVNSLDGAEVRMPKLSLIQGNQAFLGSGATVLDFTGSTFMITRDSFAQNSSRLNKVILPDTIISIGWIAFGGCKSLKTFIVLASTPPSIQSDTFNSTNSTFSIFVPDESVEAYKSATNWTSYQSRIKPLSEYVES